MPDRREQSEGACKIGGRPVTTTELIRELRRRGLLGPSREAAPGVYAMDARPARERWQMKLGNRWVPCTPALREAIRRSPMRGRARRPSRARTRGSRRTSSASRSAGGGSSGDPDKPDPDDGAPRSDLTEAGALR